LVSEAHGRFGLGLVSTGVGVVGVITSLFLWKDAPGTVRMLGSFSRSLAGIGGATSLFSGISLLQEARVRFQSRGVLRKIHPGILLGIATLSLIAVVLALVTYLATVTISFV
jgi:hypothetical protein